MSKRLSREDIVVTYIGTFGRAPLKSGFDYWSVTDEAHHTPSQLFKAFRLSDEGVTSFPQRAHYGTDLAWHEQIIIVLFRNLFNRNLTTANAGIQHWIGRLQDTTDGVTEDNILKTMVNSAITLHPDHQGTTYLQNHIADILVDVEVIKNKISVGNTLSSMPEESQAPVTSTDINGNITFTNSVYTVDLGDAYGVKDIDNTKASVDTFFQKIAIQDVNYSAEYIAAYDVLVDKSINSNKAPIKILFDMVDNTPSSDISVKEKLSIKKNALMQMLTNITLSCQQSAINIVDKKFKFRDEVEALKASRLKSEYDAQMAYTQRKVLQEQVVDNRRIRALDSLGDTYGTMMAGGLIPNEAMWQEYFRLTKELTRNTLESDKLKNFIGAWIPSNPTGADPYSWWQEPCSTVGGGTIVKNGDQLDTAQRTNELLKKPGNYFIVNLKDWNQNLPVAADAVKTNVPFQLCSLTLDGINYWKHGDIVYIDEVNDPSRPEDAEPAVLYRRMSGYSAGASVAVAPETIEDYNANGEGI